VPPAQPGVRTGGTEHPGGTARGDAQRQRRSLPGGPGEIDDKGDDLRGDADACDGLAGPGDESGIGDRAQTPGGEPGCVEPARMTIEDLEFVFARGQSEDE